MNPAALMYQKLKNEINSSIEKGNFVILKRDDSILPNVTHTKKLTHKLLYLGNLGDGLTNFSLTWLIKSFLMTFLITIIYLIYRQSR